jgi:putative N6-adenine-specific DNA methylase
MIARNIAPGLSRDFVSMKWDMIGEELWKEEKRYAYEAADFETDLNITGMDIDRRAVGAAKANADEAGVIDDLDLVCMDMTKWEPGAGIPKGVSADEYGVVISNLPYGVRIGDKEENQKLYRHYAHLIREYPTWSFFLITSDKDIEKEIEKITGRKADRRRKLYNGQIETQFYQYHGKRPPRETQNRTDHAD